MSAGRRVRIVQADGNEDLQERVKIEDQSYSASTKKIKETFETTLTEQVLPLISLELFVLYLNFCEPVRARFSEAELELINNTNNILELISMCSKRFHWFERTIFDDLPSFVDPDNHDEDLQKALCTLQALTVRYFNSPGRILTTDKGILIVHDSEYDDLTDTQREELYYTAMRARGIREDVRFDVIYCDVETSLALRVFDRPVEESSESTLYDHDTQNLLPTQQNTLHETRSPVPFIAPYT